MFSRIMAETEEIRLIDEEPELDESNGMTDLDNTLLNETDGDGITTDDPELEAIKARVREMEEEAEKLKQLQSEVDKQMNLGDAPGLSKYIVMP